MKILRKMKGKVNMKSVFEDLKDFKAYILGVVGIATTLTAFLVTVFSVDPVKTTIATGTTALVALFLGWLISRSEKRNHTELEKHIIESNNFIKEFKNDLKYLRDMALEQQRSSIRLEMNSIIRNEPHNHDTILAYAEKYFVELGGDWKETDIFFGWVESERKLERPVYMPPALIQNVQTKRALEHNNDNNNILKNE